MLYVRVALAMAGRTAATMVEYFIFLDDVRGFDE